MTKEELVEAVAAKTGVAKAVAGEMVAAFVDAVTKTLSRGEKVALPGFGIFVVSQRKARQGVNPKTGAKLQIPAMTVPKFRAGKALKEAVR